jgi:hypothetical protein
MWSMHATRRIWRGLRALEPLSPYLRGAPPGLPFQFDVPTLDRGLNFTLVTSLGDLDLLGEICPGLPVYAAAATHAKAERAIQTVLTAYLEAHPGSQSDARVRVARVSGRDKTKVDIVGPAALVGSRRSASKARAARTNGRLGGRPRKAAAAKRRTKTAR